MMQEQAPKPDEEQIIAWLNQIQPVPSARYHQKMASAPWERSQQVAQKGWRFTRFAHPTTAFRLVGLTAGILILLVAAFIFEPNLRAVAQRIAQYFLPAENDQVTFIPSQVSPIDGDAITAYFPLSLDVAQKLAGIELKSLPETRLGVDFQGAHYDPHLQSVTLRYANEDFILLISQRPVSPIEEYASIGASAPLETVNVRGVTGEYVAGGWRLIIETGVPDQDTRPLEGSELSIRWDPLLPQRILRWQEDYIIYEILTTGRVALEKSELINLAEQLK